MGLFDRFTRWGVGRRASLARSRELGGHLAEAVTLYLDADLPDQAARVLLLRADAEGSPEQRLAFCDMAARTAKSENIRNQARGRKALISFDVIRSRPGIPLRTELARVALELEQAKFFEPAIEAYVLLGDTDGEVRVLTELGAIERLEERLKASHSESRKARTVVDARRKIIDLDRVAERRTALEFARTTLDEQDDDNIRDIVRTIRARLLTSPTVDFDIHGNLVRCAFGREVTIGRGEATIVAHMRAISRVHVAIHRERNEIFVRDLDTRNGTMLAGARIDGPIAIRSAVRIDLGGEVPCTIDPTTSFEHDIAPEGVVVNVASTRWIAPLGELVVGAWRIDRVVRGTETFIVLRTPEGAARPILGDYELAAEVELCQGDEIRAQRGGPVVLRIVSGPDARAISGAST